MKIYISADIEGVVNATTFSNCEYGKEGYSSAADMMTREVAAACEGARDAGAVEIVVKDAHGSATNIDMNRLPEYASLIRGWTGHPYSMVEGIDKSFDACLFIGYHSAASRCGNALSHTYSGRVLSVKINGRLASEFTLFSYAAALEGVPTVFLAGDKMLCDDYADLHPLLKTYAVKDGLGAMTISKNPAVTLKGIKQGVEDALRQDLSKALVELPKAWELELVYKDHKIAVDRGFFPGVERIGDNTLIFKTSSYYELLNAFKFII